MAIAIVACDENNVIGDGDKIPWHIPDDLKHFKKTTDGQIVIMGRNTWMSLPRKPLPNRVNCIISRTKTYDMISMFDMDIDWFVSVKSAMDFSAVHSPGKKQFIIGGEQIYKIALNENLVDEIIMTKVKGVFKGDKYFPKLDDSWKETETISETDQYRIVIYKKVKI
jgi:dihydrofolate reductase